jgi:acetoacetyl-CoA reductase/3-oxoacyl-[acyl-carrier protein] reductase
MIIITGASRGIGKFLFDRYQKSDVEVFGTYNSTISKAMNKDTLFKVDVSSFTEVSSWIKKIENKLDKIILINCAGKNYNSFAHKAEIGKWEEVIKVNLLGTFYVIRNLLPYMRYQKYGRIINFSSVAAQIPTPGLSAYAASKSALWGMTRSLASENGAKGITINNINLGYSAIGMGIEEVPSEYSELIKNRIPSNEFCSPEDIFNTVEFIINTKYINGSSIDLNGGIS